MKTNYQFDYAAGRPQMYDEKSRKEKATRMIKTLEQYFGPNKLKKFTVLDVGASTGIIDNELAKSFRKVTGIDIDKQAITFAQKHFKKANLKFKTGDAMNIKSKDDVFDIVICAHIYEHVSNPQKLFQEIYRILKPGGICYLAAVNALWPWEPHYDLLFLSWLPKPLANIYVKLFNKADSYYETPLFSWQLRDLTKHFKIHDFTPKIIRDPEKYGYPKSWKLLAAFASKVSFWSPTMFWLLEK